MSVTTTPELPGYLINTKDTLEQTHVSIHEKLHQSWKWKQGRKMVLLIEWLITNGVMQQSAHSTFSHA